MKRLFQALGLFLIATSILPISGIMADEVNKANQSIVDNNAIGGEDNGIVTVFDPASVIPTPDGTITTPNGKEVRPHPLGGVELSGIDGSITNKPQDNPLVKKVVKDRLQLILMEL